MSECERVSERGRGWVRVLGRLAKWVSEVRFWWGECCCETSNDTGTRTRGFDGIDAKYPWLLKSWRKSTLYLSVFSGMREWMKHLLQEQEKDETIDWTRNQHPYLTSTHHAPRSEPTQACHLSRTPSRPPHPPQTPPSAPPHDRRPRPRIASARPNDPPGM